MSGDELREDAARALFEHDQPNLYWETAGVKTQIEYAQRADAVLALPAVRELVADREGASTCQECGHKLRYHVDPGGCTLGDCHCEHVSEADR